MEGGRADWSSSRGAPSEFVTTEGTRRVWDKTMRSSARRNGEGRRAVVPVRASGRRWDGSWDFRNGSSGWWSSKAR